MPLRRRAGSRHRRRPGMTSRAGSTGRTACARPPLLVYAHGGSFALGDLDGWDGALRDLVRESGVAVLPCRLPPCAGASLSRGLRRHAGGNPPCRARGRSARHRSGSGSAAGGDSAGANLALGAALALRDAGASPLRFLLLHYGAYSTDGDSPSWQRFGSGAYVLSRAQLRLGVGDLSRAIPAQKNGLARRAAAGAERTIMVPTRRGTPLLPMGLGRSNDVPGTQHLRQGRDAEAQTPL